MKLDRNINRGGRGKYALVNMRKLIPVLDRHEAHKHNSESCNEPTAEESGLVHCFAVLLEAGIITLGNETPGDQFFVMKYKDKFTASGLHAYAVAVAGEGHKVGDANPKGSKELLEYADQMFLEAREAEKLGNRIPD